MKVDWLQLPADVPEARAGALADRLRALTGRKVSEGDALLMVVRLWQWALVKVDPEAADLEAEFERCAVLSNPGAATQVARACRWPERLGMELLDALQHPDVAVLVAEPGDRIRIDRLAARYAKLASQQQDARGRAQAAKVAKRQGWVANGEGGWANAKNPLETVPGWRELLARFQQPKVSAVVEGRLMPLKAARVVRAAEED